MSVAFLSLDPGHWAFGLSSWSYLRCINAAHWRLVVVTQ